MVVKQVAAKKGTGSFGGLADYLLDKQHDGKKVHDYEFSNCSFGQEVTSNLKEIQNTSSLNVDAKSDRVLHLVVSFHEDEQPTKEQLQYIERELVKAIGMEDHQRLTVAHSNTNNFHIHIAINKIHPETKKLIDPYRSKKKLSEKAFELEEKFGFRRDQNQLIEKEIVKEIKEIKFKKGENNERQYTREQRAVAKKRVQESANRKIRGRKQTKSINDLRKVSECYLVHNRPKHTQMLLQGNDDVELGSKRGNISSGVRWAGDGNDRTTAVPGRAEQKSIEIHSGVKNLSTWIKEEVLEDLQQVIKDDKATFEDLQQVLAEANLELKPRGNGVVIAHKSRKLFVKSSSIHRSLSKAQLEKRFGKPLAFKSIAAKPKREFGMPKHDLWEQYKKRSDERRAAKKQLLAEAKQENTQAKEAIKSKYEHLIEEIKQDPILTYHAKRMIYQSIFANRKKEYQELSKVYKAKRDEIHKRTNQISYKEFLIQKALEGDSKALAALRKTKVKLEPDEKAILGKTDHKIFITKDPQITKQGLVVYRIGDHGKIIDKGDRLRITIDSNELAIKEMLEMSIAKYGNNLDISGDLAFKQKVLAVTEKYDLKINFKDKTMQEIRDAAREANKQHSKKRRVEQKTEKKGMAR